MKKIVLAIAVGAIASFSFADVVIDDFEGETPPSAMTQWNSPWQGWTVGAGTGEAGTQGASRHAGVQWHTSVLATGVAAPAAIGDSVSFSSRFKVGVGTNSIAANLYAWDIGLSADGTAGTGSTGIQFARRNQGVIGGSTVGQAWDLFGWSNNSTIGLDNSGVNAVSDWFGMRVTITSTAGGYSVLGEVLANDGSTIYSNLNENEALANLSGATTWYGKLSMNNANAADIDSLVVDNVALESIPEPATLSFMAIISGALFFIRRRFA